MQESAGKAGYSDRQPGIKMAIMARAVAIITATGQLL